MLKRNHAVRNGIILFVLLGLYFLILDALGWADNTFLRLGNYIFVIAMLINSIKNAVKNGENYLVKLAVGIATVFIGITLGVISLFIYLQIFEPSLERYISPILAANNYSGLCFALFIESLTSSMIIVFIISQFYKNTKPDKG
jgi:hypothetical protein